MFMAIPLGFKAAVEIIFIVLAGGIMFRFMEKSNAVENGIGTLIKRLGRERKYLIVVIMTFIYGLLGVAVGYENNIAMIPIVEVYTGRGIFLLQESLWSNDHRFWSFSSNPTLLEQGIN